MVLVVEPHVIDAERDAQQGFAAPVGKATSLELSPERIGADLVELLDVVEALPRESKAGYAISEVSFELAVTAEGRLALLGSGVKSGAKAGITVKVTRQRPKSKDGHQDDANETEPAVTGRNRGAE